ncbi:unnamed protein product [Fasciola hepatica]|uniref:Uncharacterized protein n=1 Tax=Fasciola hepatica TaxID=6192 RepID=A0ABC9HH86_FASHE
MHKGYCESKTKGFGLEIDHYWNSRNRSNVEKTSGKNSLLYFNLKCYRQYSWKYVIANLSQLLSVENALYKRKNLGLMFAVSEDVYHIIQITVNTWTAIISDQRAPCALGYKNALLFFTRSKICRFYSKVADRLLRIVLSVTVLNIFLICINKLLSVECRSPVSIS